MSTLRFGRKNRASPEAPWRDALYCVMDIETTGLDSDNDEIISAGAVRIEQGRILASENFYAEIKPTRRPSQESMQIHGLREIDLRNARSLAEVLPKLMQTLEGSVLIAHAAWIETSFLKRHFPKSKRQFFNGALDTAALARKTGFSGEVDGQEPSLEWLARKLNLPVYAPHNALGDALTTAVVFLALATELEREGLARGESILTLGQLQKISKAGSWPSLARSRVRL